MCSFTCSCSLVFALCSFIFVFFSLRFLCFLPAFNRTTTNNHKLVCKRTPGTIGWSEGVHEWNVRLDSGGRGVMLGAYSVLLLSASFFVPDCSLDCLLVLNILFSWFFISSLVHCSGSIFFVCVVFCSRFVLSTYKQTGISLADIDTTDARKSVKMAFAVGCATGRAVRRAPCSMLLLACLRGAIFSVFACFTSTTPLVLFLFLFLNQCGLRCVVLTSASREIVGHAAQ
jgi:hypothetical protein